MRAHGTHFRLNISRNKRNTIRDQILNCYSSGRKRFLSTIYLVLQVGLRRKTYNVLTGSVLSVWTSVESILTNDGQKKGQAGKMQVWGFTKLNQLHGDPQNEQLALSQQASENLYIRFGLRSLNLEKNVIHTLKALRLPLEIFMEIISFKIPFAVLFNEALKYHKSRRIMQIYSKAVMWIRINCIRVRIQVIKITKFSKHLLIFKSKKKIE